MGVKNKPDGFYKDMLKLGTFDEAFCKKPEELRALFGRDLKQALPTERFDSLLLRVESLARNLIADYGDFNPLAVAMTFPISTSVSDVAADDLCANFSHLDFEGVSTRTEFIERGFQEFIKLGESFVAKDKVPIVVFVISQVSRCPPTGKQYGLTIAGRTFDGRFNHAIYNVTDNDDDVNGLDEGIRYGCEATSSRDTSSFTWLFKMLDLFFEAYVKGTVEVYHRLSSEFN
jgi:hypothetical protein